MSQNMRVVPIDDERDKRRFRRSLARAFTARASKEWLPDLDTIEKVWI